MTLARGVGEGEDDTTVSVLRSVRVQEDKAASKNAIKSSLIGLTSIIPVSFHEAEASPPTMKISHSMESTT
jgi:hypothetical protein